MRTHATNVVLMPLYMHMSVTLPTRTRHDTCAAMRISRSSRQAAAASALLKAVATQERLAAAEKINMAAEEQAAGLLHGSARVAWLDHAAKAVNELALEETAKQVAQRQAAMASQKTALLEALAQMRADEAAILREMKAQQAHAESVFLGE